MIISGVLASALYSTSCCGPHAEHAGLLSIAGVIRNPLYDFTASANRLLTLQRSGTRTSKVTFGMLLSLSS